MTPHASPSRDSFVSPRRAPLRGLLRGYRFRPCESPEDVSRAFAVRRRVYTEECGYDVAIPDAYDARSWMLLAEEVASGEAVGSIRLTPRSTGPIEAEEYFRLPPALLDGRIVEATRFAILPSHRGRGRLLPAVALGLLKATIRFVLQVGADTAVVCAKPERVWTYEWIGFERTGRTAPYRKLGGVEHELMVNHVGNALERTSGRRVWDFFMASDDPEIELPAREVWPGIAHTG